MGAILGIKGKAGAWHLLGLTLDSGWKVIEPVRWDPSNGTPIDHYNGTGGNFSVPYIVEKEGKKAFLKAIDFTEAMSGFDTANKLQKITEAHLFETHVLGRCKNERMNRVVVAIDSGEISVGDNIQDAAPYLIFELADGDVRRKIQKFDGDYKFAWWLKVMHHTSVGLSQLHSKGITHQDLKPSNILAFDGTKDFKISDLGRSTCESRTAPHENVLFSGDPRYTPPELAYGHITPNIRMRRICNDMYLLGSMIFFFSKGFGCTVLLMDSLEFSQKPQMFNGTWSQDYSIILPVIQHSFTKILDDLGDEFPLEFSDKLVSAAQELCNPDPMKRGHPRERCQPDSKFLLQRYVSLFDLLARKALVHARTKSRK